MSFSFPKHQQRQMVVGARAVEKKVKVGRWSSSSPNVVLDGFTPIFHRFDPCGSPPCILSKQVFTFQIFHILVKMKYIGEINR